MTNSILQATLLDTIQQLVKMLPDGTAITIVVPVDNRGFEVHTNACIVCTAELLEEYIERNNVEHLGHSEIQSEEIVH